MVDASRQQTLLVSIGVPIFNEARYIASALESLLAQDYDNLEIIITDNASADGTDEICRTFAARDDRIRYYRSATNEGATRNFNRALELATGEYFSWAGGHDMREPGAMAACVAYLEANPDAVLCYPRTLLEGLDGGRTEVTDDTVDTMGLSRRARFRKTVLELSICNALHGVIPSSALRAIRPLQPVLGADHVLLVELSLLGGFHQLDEPLFIRREVRPPPGEDSRRVARILDALGIASDSPAARAPYEEMLREHVRGLRASPIPLPARLALAPTTMWWLWRRWGTNRLLGTLAGKSL